MNAEEMVGLSVREVLGRMEAKLDALAGQVTVLQVSTATDRAALEGRVSAVEKAGDRRWSLVGAWVGSVTAVGIALLDLVLHH